MKVSSLFLVVVWVVLVLGSAAHADVVINEIMYNSPGTPDVEWIELYNSGPTMVELDDWYFIDSDPLHPHCILSGDLAPGEFLLVVGDLTTFAVQYPGVGPLNINGFDPAGTGFGLSNSGEALFLYNDDGILADTVVYVDGGAWPGSPDGDGPTLELVNPVLDNNNPTSWDPSLVIGGTPGQINSTFQDNQAPIIHDTDKNPDLPQVGDNVLITALVSDASDLDRVELFVDLGAGFVSRLMYDDGFHGDGAAADSLFGATIDAEPEGTLVRYYVAAYDDFGNMVTKPSTAPLAFHAYTVGYLPVSGLRVNEVMASNVGTLADEYGEFDDWVEIVNVGTEARNLDGMFLTDNYGDHRKWDMPAIILEGQSSMLIWCDGQPEQGILHTTFKLSASGEDIALYDTEEHGNTRLSGFHFGVQGADISVGWSALTTGLPGSGKTIENHFLEPEYLASPTPGYENSEPLSGVVINEFQTTSASGGVDDWIEFHNRSTEAVNISGWGVSDDPLTPLKWVFPLGTILDAGTFIVVDETVLGFSLSSIGEMVQLSSADGLTGIDFVQFGEQQPDVSYGRSYSHSYWSFFDEVTPGAANPGLLSPVETAELPSSLRVTGVHPNPFNPVTKIHFELPREGRVTVDIYGVDGRLVRTIDGGVMAAGAGNLTFNGLDDSGRRVASGAFFARVRAGGETSVVKMMLVK